DLLARARVLVDAHQARFLDKLDPQAAAHFLSALDTLLEGVHDRFDDP
ncbi:MAG: MarR family transcriptional regulator, partial [Sulfitobacter sp.]|nr:MarR family transcriptional regulator [Sulfitobacter sp.]